MIPRTIFTVWLTESDKLPLLIERCIKSHNIPNYGHRMITLDNCYKDCPYLRQALKVKAWGKMCDYLRCYYLIKEGGIYLDADVEMLPNKNFDSLLDNHLFAARENNNFINTAVLGAKKGNQLLKDHLEEVVTRFRGDDGLFFESSLELITPRLYAAKDVKILEPEYFYPYDHQRGTVDIKDFTVCYHHFQKSWK